jgi:hypothetical protein
MSKTAASAPRTTPRTIHVKLPTSAEVTSDPLTLWLEKYNVTMTVRVYLGKAHVTLEGGELLSFSDETGEKRESWSISRSAISTSAAVAAAVEAACKHHVKVRA